MMTKRCPGHSADHQHVPLAGHGAKHSRCQEAGSYTHEFCDRVVQAVCASCQLTEGPTAAEMEPRVGSQQDPQESEPEPKLDTNAEFAHNSTNAEFSPRMSASDGYVLDYTKPEFVNDEFSLVPACDEFAPDNNNAEFAHDESPPLFASAEFLTGAINAEFASDEATLRPTANAEFVTSDVHTPPPTELPGSNEFVTGDMFVPWQC
eukprot:5731156-Amphidinium_carterae.1